jgi:hypothetical protein
VLNAAHSKGVIPSCHQVLINPYRLVSW